MSNEFEKAFELANLMSIIANQKSALIEEFEQNSFHFFNGGCFKVDQSLISFLSAIHNLGEQNIVLIDVNKLPVHIDNVETFLQDVLQCYITASNNYLSSYKTIQNSRNIKNLLDL